MRTDITYRSKDQQNANSCIKWWKIIGKIYFSSKNSIYVLVQDEGL